MAANRVVLVDMALVLMAATAATKAMVDMAETRDTAKIKAMATAPKLVMAASQATLLADMANKVAKEASESGTAQAVSKITTSRITDTVAATAAANKADTVATTHMANKTLVVEVAAVGEVEAAVAADMEEDTTNMEAPNLSTTSCQPIAVTACLLAVSQILSERKTSPCSSLLLDRS